MYIIENGGVICVILHFSTNHMTILKCKRPQTEGKQKPTDVKKSN